MIWIYLGIEMFCKCLKWLLLKLVEIIENITNMVYKIQTDGDNDNEKEHEIEK